MVVVVGGVWVVDEVVGGVWVVVVAVEVVFGLWMWLLVKLKVL